MAVRTHVAPQPELITFLLSEMPPETAVTARRFFGGWELLTAARQFAIVMKGTLYFKVDGAIRAEMERQGCRPFSYATAKRQVSVPKYMSAPEGSLDDIELLQDWVRRVTAVSAEP